MSETLICKNCNIEFERTKSQISSAKAHNTKNTFCSRSCGISYNNKHKEVRNKKI